MSKGIIGYVKIYIKITCKEETLYAVFDGDFGKPLTRRRLNSMKKSIASVYEKFGLHVMCSEFVTKEEYEANNNPEDSSIDVSWDENSTHVDYREKE